MAQLTEDEWPKDHEPTTAEKERGMFKREGPHPPGKRTGTPTEDTSRRGADEAIIPDAALDDSAE